MAKRRGNPNWGKPEPYNFSNAICSFDSLVKTLKLTPDQYEGSEELKRWSERNKDTKYIPQELLQVWNILPKSG
jgi:hypothetical protein